MEPVEPIVDRFSQPPYGRRHWGSPTIVAVLWVLGLLIGHVWPYPIIWLIAAAVFLAISILIALLLRSSWIKHVLSLAILAVAAAWMPIQTQVPLDDISHYAGHQPQLARLIGEVVAPVSHWFPPEHGLDRYLTRPPSTRYVLKVNGVILDDVQHPASGRVIVRMSKHDHRIQAGDLVNVTGWLERIKGPSNPGQFNYQNFMATQGIHSGLRVTSRNGWQKVSDTGLQGVMYRTSNLATQAATDSLGLGMQGKRLQISYLAAILLGQRGSEFQQLFDAFQKIGLAHVLAISGAHLGVLLGIVWLIGKLLIPSPRLQAIVIVIFLMGFMLVVPLRVPILRAGVMALVFTTAYGCGRHIRGVDLLAIAALILLVWRPTDLFRAGFQLSFVVTGALIYFVRSASEILWHQPILNRNRRSIGAVLARGLCGYVAVSLVAASVGVPLAAYHFGILTPLSALMSLPAIPIAVMALGLGYFKIVLGMIYPSVGAVLAEPLSDAADLMIWFVGSAGQWPGASIQLHTPPSGIWVFTTCAVAAAFWSGMFSRRPVALLMSITICTAWLVGVIRSDVPIESQHRNRGPIEVRVNMMALGDGSSYLIRLVGQNSSVSEDDGGQTWMFDCGSLTYLDVGDRVIVPALKAVGVNRVDTLVISHANLDHYNGCLPVVERFGVKRVLTTSHVLAEAAQHSHSPTAQLIRSLRLLGLEPQTVSTGWQEKWGNTTLEVLWPPNGLQIHESNDASIVLKATASGASMIFCGDIQDYAQKKLMASGKDLTATVCELPHHGSFVRSSLAWIDTVTPRLVLQSASRRRVLNDRWLAPLQHRSIMRALTASSGHTQLDLYHDGTVTWNSYNSNHTEVIVPADRQRP